MRWGRALAAAALLAGVVAVYAPAARLGFIYDDHELIVEREPPSGPGEIARVFAERHWPTLPYYRPIPRASMLVQKALHGDWPAPYHGLNVLLAAALALCAWALLREPSFGLPEPLPWLGAALFALHPIASSCVYPIASGRETLWPTLFEIAAVLGFLRSGARAYALALAATAAALLSKEHAVVLPGIFLLADWLRGYRGPWLRRHAPVWGLVLAYLGLRALIFRGGAGGGGLELAVLRDPTGPPLALLYAVQTALLPTLALVYEPVVEVWLEPWGALAAAGLAVTALGALALRGAEWRRRALFWSGWIVLGLLPTANLLEQEARFDERYVLCALVGFVALGLSALAPLGTRSVTVAAAVLLAAAAGVSASRARFFASDEAFLAQWIATDSGRAQPRLSLAKLALREGDATRALEQAEAALARAPAFADAHNTLGLAREALGEGAQAEAAYRRAIELAPESPLAHNNLGVLLLERRDFAGAARAFEAALAADPRNVNARINLAIARAQEGETTAAIAELEAVLAARPRHAAACFNLGVVLEGAGQRERALDAYRCALESRPDYALARERLERLAAP